MRSEVLFQHWILSFVLRTVVIFFSFLFFFQTSFSLHSSFSCSKSLSVSFPSLNAKPCSESFFLFFTICASLWKVSASRCEFRVWFASQCATFPSLASLSLASLSESFWALGKRSETRKIKCEAKSSFNIGFYLLSCVPSSSSFHFSFSFKLLFLCILHFLVLNLFLFHFQV